MPPITTPEVTMTDYDYTARAEELIEDEFPEDIEVTTDEIASSIERLVNEFSVPIDEAVRSTRSKYEDDYDGDGEFSTSNQTETEEGSIPEYPIGDLQVELDDEMMTIEGKVTRLFEVNENASEYFSQKGLIADETGQTLFTISKDASEGNDTFPVEKGESYRLQGVTGDAYQGDMGVMFNENASISELDTEFDVASSSPDEDEQYEIADLTVENDEEWMTVEGTVTRLFDLTGDTAEYFTQQGLIADDTGEKIFKITKDAAEEDEVIEVEEGESYRFESVVGDAYQGDISIKVTTPSEITGISEDFTPPENDTHVTGCIVNVQGQVGLIKRCPEENCTRVLNKGRCTDHGDVDGEHDLRMMATVDTGTSTEDVFFNKEATEALTGISLDKAIEIANDAVDMEKPGEEMKRNIVGRYYSIAGNTVGEYVLVNQFERVDEDWEEQAEDTLDRIENINTNTEATA